MSKILAESLHEYRDSKSVNEARGLFGDLAAQGKQFRKMFLPAGYAIIQSGKKDTVASLGKWLKKLAEMGWPSDKEIKAKLGDKGFKKLVQANKFLNNNLPSFAAGPAGGVTSKKADSGKSDEQRAQAIAQVMGIEVSELVDLLKKE